MPPNPSMCLTRQLLLVQSSLRQEWQRGVIIWVASAKEWPSVTKCFSQYDMTKTGHFSWPSKKPALSCLVCWQTFKLSMLLAWSCQSNQICLISCVHETKVEREGKKSTNCVCIVKTLTPRQIINPFMAQNREYVVIGSDLSTHYFNGLRQPIKCYFSKCAKWYPFGMISYGIEAILCCQLFRCCQFVTDD